MAIKQSAKKATRVSERRHVFNLRREKAFKESVKMLRKLVTAKAGAEALKAMPATYQAIDKAAKRGLIKKNTAARIKSGLTKKVRAIA